MPPEVSREILVKAAKALAAAGEAGLTREELGTAIGRKEQKTLDRVLTGLAEMGGEIQKIPTGRRDGPRKCYVLRRNPEEFEQISEQVRSALRLAEVMMGCVGSELWGQYLESVRQLCEKNLTPKDEALLRSLRDQVCIKGSPSHVGRSSPDILVSLLGALQAHPAPPRMTLSYCSDRSIPAKKHPILPFHLIHDAFAGGSYLLAWSNLTSKGKPMIFRLDRIESLEIQPELALPTMEQESKLKIARDFQIGAYLGSGNHEPFEIKVRITKDTWVKYIHDTPPPFPKYQEIAYDKKSLTASFWAITYRGPARWILQMGPGAEVLEPYHFRTYIAKKFEEGGALYR